MSYVMVLKVYHRFANLLIHGIILCWLFAAVEDSVPCH